MRFLKRGSDKTCGRRVASGKTISAGTLAERSEGKTSPERLRGLFRGSVHIIPEIFHMPGIVRAVGQDAQRVIKEVHAAFRLLHHQTLARLICENPVERSH